MDIDAIPVRHFEFPDCDVAVTMKRREEIQRYENTALEEYLGYLDAGVIMLGPIAQKRELFVAKWIPVVPYRDDGTFNPYPVFNVQARDAESGDLLAETKVVAPVSTEADCYRCHGGEPRNALWH